jgi:hypothetical protein
MKIHSLILISLFSFLVSTSVFSQTPGEWTWMSGDTISGRSPVYGIQGVPSIFNHPPSVYEGCEWTDSLGNFWFYGGINSDSTGMIYTYGDLWKFNPLTNEWTWVFGPGIPDQIPVYGTLRVAAATNYPGAKCFGPISATDHNGIFWMYGGYEHSNSKFYSDLWSYDPSTNMWTWMSGQTSNLYVGSFGVQGVPSLLNFPPSKQECNAGWVDANNNVWIFGGQISIGDGNDLWKFDVQTYEWTWMKGDSTSNAIGVYGVKGVPDPANTPDSRQVYCKWTDSDNNFWIFGGAGHNDLWRYEVSTNQWTWMTGSSGSGGSEFVDSLCHPSSLNTPSGRTENRAAWKDTCDNLITFGGFGKNDLWSYNRFTNKWSKLFQGPASNVGSYGIKGVSSSTNTPGDKGGASAWVDANHNLWMFGGITGIVGYMNDMWRYVPDPACQGCVAINPIAIFNSPDHVICPGTCTDFQNLSSLATSYIWIFPGGNPATSVDVNPTNICYNSPGNYDVTLIASNAFGSDTLTLSNYVTVFPSPPPQGVLQNGDTLSANQGSTSYQWYFNGNIISGATIYFYIAPASGNYSVVATDENGCEVEAVINNVIANTNQLAMSSWQLAIVPNPVTSTIDIQGLENKTADEINIFNVFGEKVFSTVHCKLPIAIPIAIGNKFSPGIYWVEVVSGGKTFRADFVKE